MTQNTGCAGLCGLFGNNEVRELLILIRHLSAFQLAMEAAAWNTAAEVAPIFPDNGAGVGMRARCNHVSAQFQQLCANFTQFCKTGRGSRFYNQEQLLCSVPECLDSLWLLLRRNFVENIRGDDQVSMIAQRSGSHITGDPCSFLQIGVFHQSQSLCLHGLFFFHAGDTAQFQKLGSGPGSSAGTGTDIK